MVKIHSVYGGHAALDEAATQLFRTQWAMYRRQVEANYVYHREAYGTLRRLLLDEFDRPFWFLDLACGDAKESVGALVGTRITHYHGVDLSPQALEMATQNLDALGCEVDLEQADFVEAIRNRPDPADVVWFGLSLHHLEAPDKRELMREIHEAMAAGGRFLIFEPAMREGEHREAWHDRIEQNIRARWTALSKNEFDMLVQHIRQCDIPETVSGWQALGREAGFRNARLLFRTPDDLLAVICFDK